MSKKAPPHPKLLVILGPTSSGKSSLAIKIAQEWNGEIVSADSRQVYRGMDIGTGKVTKEEQALVPHHLLDVANPGEEYNVSHFLRDARTAIEDITNRGKLPVICGGTGFWIEALVDNQSLPAVPPDSALREELSRETSGALLERLKALDPKRAETIDQKNPRRLIRAIEIARSKKEGSGTENNASKDLRSSFSIPHSLLIALCPPKSILDEKIKTRLDARFAEGMIGEVEQLHRSGVSWDRLDAFGLEYRWISRYLRKMLSEQGMKEKLFFDSIHYAKRQMTWIRRWQKKNSSLHKVETPEEAALIIRDFAEQTEDSGTPPRTPSHKRS